MIILYNFNFVFLLRLSCVWRLSDPCLSGGTDLSPSLIKITTKFIIFKRLFVFHLCCCGKTGLECLCCTEREHFDEHAVQTEKEQQQKKRTTLFTWLFPSVFSVSHTSIKVSFIPAC